MHSFGRLVPKDWGHVNAYPFRRLGIGDVLTVNKVIRRPPLVDEYDQQGNSCTGYSASWMSSIYNSSPFKLMNPCHMEVYRPKTRVYDALWLYHEGQLTDGDPTTDPQNDVGGYLDAVFEVLRTQGHRLILKNGSILPPNIREGIQSYYWCTQVDEMRTAISLNRPIVFGINWYEEFMYPVRRSTGYWIGTHSDFGSVLGGHAICCHGARDSYEGFRLINTWGREYPPIWIPYKAIERLMSEDGESGVAMDL